MQFEEFYRQISIPANQDLINTLLDKYCSISFDDLKRTFEGGNSELQDLLYKKINSITLSKKGFNQEQKRQFLSKVNQDFIMAGKPFNPATHGGRRNPIDAGGWEEFKSWNLLGTNRIPTNDQLHRFYIGVPCENLHEFSSILYDNFKKANIPFYFKINHWNQERTDNLVIYTSTELLNQTMNIINNININQKDLMDKCSSPSCLMGKYTEKIGYAEEIYPFKKSYTDTICSIFIETLTESLHKYARNNPNSPVKDLYKKLVLDKIKDGFISEYAKEKAKERILLDLLNEYEPNFKNQLLNDFRANIQKNGIDIENICFNDFVKNTMGLPSKKNENQTDINRVTMPRNIKEFAFELQRLNPDVDIKLANPSLVQNFEELLFTSTPIGDLVLPQGFQYDEKNGINNKHNSLDGNYISIHLEDIKKTNPTLMINTEYKKSKSESIQYNTNTEFNWKSEEEKQAYEEKARDNQAYFLEHQLEKQDDYLNSKRKHFSMGFANISMLIVMITTICSIVSFLTYYLIKK